MSEVCNFLLAEYDYDTDIAVQRDEAYRVGVETGREEGMLEGAYTKAIETAKNCLALNMPIEIIAKITSLSQEEIKTL